MRHQLTHVSRSLGKRHYRQCCLRRIATPFERWQHAIPKLRHSPYRPNQHPPAVILTQHDVAKPPRTYRILREPLQQLDQHMRLPILRGATPP